MSNKCKFYKFVLTAFVAFLIINNEGMCGICSKTVSERIKERLFLKPKEQIEEIEQAVSRVLASLEDLNFKKTIDNFQLPDRLKIFSRQFSGGKKIQIALDSGNASHLEMFEELAKSNHNVLFVFDARPPKDSLFGNVFGHQAVGFYDPEKDAIRVLNMRGTNPPNTPPSKASAKVVFENMEEFADYSLANGRPAYVTMLALSEQEMKVVQDISIIRYGDDAIQNRYHLFNNNCGHSTVGIICEVTGEEVLRIIATAPHLARAFFDNRSERAVGRVLFNLSHDEALQPYLVKIANKPLVRKILPAAPFFIFYMSLKYYREHVYLDSEYSEDSRFLELKFADIHSAEDLVDVVFRSANYSLKNDGNRDYCSKINQFYSSSIDEVKQMMVAYLTAEFISEQNENICDPNKFRSYPDQSFSLLSVYLINYLDFEYEIRDNSSISDFLNSAL